MLESEKLAIAAHLHVVMRRKIGRVTDVEWMIRSPEYAREIIRVALSDPQHVELLDWANRLQDALFPASLAKPERRADAPDSRLPGDFADSRLKNPLSPKAPPPPRYVGSLR
ncbi:hypothetical protein [Ideonella livida]|uniref:Uncharacterized protein n=1 Tax=Ideonella livida TaxID=2707176 RepID=A0A7C9THD2_9BURK|nr:hypothetical protein [Ideonella livida]NDY90519.1 hypothetical protein [Ideonella livida]